jgi:hypothetical protein
MEKILKNLIEDDIENVLDSNKIEEKDFFFSIIHYLLENVSINLIDVQNINEELKTTYNHFLDDLEIELAEANGQIINVLREAPHKFKQRIAPLLKKIEDMKNGYNNNNTRKIS